MQYSKRCGNVSRNISSIALVEEVHTGLSHSSMVVLIVRAGQRKSVV